MEIDKERESTLEQLQDWLEKPMLVLSSSASSPSP